MKRKEAIFLANKKESETNETHFVVWEPQDLKEALTASGYRVKSETEMIDEYGSVENFLPHVVHVSSMAS